MALHGSKYRAATQYRFQNSLFTDFSLTFDRFPDRFGRSIFAIFIHRQLENFVQIFMCSDLIFKEKSQTINIRKGMFLNINCLQFMLRNIPSLILLAIYGKPKASKLAIFLKFFKFPDFSMTFFIFKFP